MLFDNSDQYLLETIGRNERVLPSVVLNFFRNGFCIRFLGAKKLGNDFDVCVRSPVLFFVILENLSTVRLFVDRDEISILRDGGEPIAFLAYLVEDFVR